MARLEYYYNQAHMYLAHAILELVHLVRPPLHCSTPGMPLPLPLALPSLPGGRRRSIVSKLVLGVTCTWSLL